MSIDFDAVCFKCKKVQHIGQSMGGNLSFGYGSGDVAGAATAARFALEHAMFCGDDAVRIMREPPEEFMWIPTEERDKDEPGYGKGSVNL